MDGNDVGTLQEFLQTHAGIILAVTGAGGRIVDNLHSEGLCNLGHFLADGTHAHNAQGFARQFHEGMAIVYMHRILAVLTGLDEVLVVEGTACQVQNMHPGRLGHGIRGVARHIADNDAPLFAELDIYIVDARSGLTYEFQLGCGIQESLVHDYFV